jgi:5'-3' exoribonuclease 1
MVLISTSRREWVPNNSQGSSVHRCSDGGVYESKERLCHAVANEVSAAVPGVSSTPSKQRMLLVIAGVAPRAKMNQQRSRRFKSAEERKELRDEQIRKGEAVDPDPFDSNCITPGTAFMARLGKHLKFFIRKKMAEDVTWQTPAVVFSGERLCAPVQLHS